MFRQAMSRVRNTFALDISAAKSRTQQWEPTLRLPSCPTVQDSDDPDDQNGPWFNTYTTFDPGCARPFLISGLSIGIKDLKPTVPIPSPDAKAIVQSDAKAIVTEQVKKKGKVVAHLNKPWPYRLPKALQPQVGTTFAAMYGSGLGSSTSTPSSALEKVGVLQAVLYGVPEPDKAGWKGQDDGFLHKVLYGAKEEEEEK